MITVNRINAIGIPVKQEQVSPGTKIADLVAEGTMPAVVIDGLGYFPEEYDYEIPDGSVVTIRAVPREGFTLTAALIIIGGLIVGAGAGYAIQQWNERQQKKIDRLLENSRNVQNRRASASSTYNKRSQGNYFRDGQPTPVWYGSMRGFPDLVAEPYFTYETHILREGEEGYDSAVTNTKDYEFVHYLMVVTEGLLTYPRVTRPDGTSALSVQLGDTSIASIPNDDIIVSFVNQADPAGTTSFYDAYSTPAKLQSTPLEAEVKNSASTTQRYDSTKKGAGNGDNYAGPIPLSPPGVDINRAYLSFRSRQGLYWSDGGAVVPWYAPIYAEFRKIKDDGSPESGATWMQVNPVLAVNQRDTRTSVRDGYRTTNWTGSFDATSATSYGFLLEPKDQASTTPTNSGQTERANEFVGETVRYNLPSSGRWECRVRLGRSRDDGYRGEPEWYAARGYRSVKPDYRTDVQYLKVKIRATPQTEGTREMLSIDATRRLHDFNASGKVGLPVATRDIDKAIYDLLTNDTYGLGFDDDEIDLAELKRLGNIWRTQGRHFDYIFDRHVEPWEALTLMCQAGRCDSRNIFGIQTFLPYEAKTMPVASFTNENIVEGSFKVSFGMPGVDDEFDGTKVIFWNRNTWSEDSYSYAVGGGTPKNPREVRLDGITDRARAVDECEFLEKDRHYHNKLISWSTEMDGNGVKLNDLVAITYDMLDPAKDGWDTTVTGVAGTNTVLLRDPVPASLTGGIVAAFRQPDGEPSRIETVNISADRMSLTIPGWTLDTTKSVAGESAVFTRGGREIAMDFSMEIDPTVVQMGALTAWSRLALITKKVPNGTTGVDLEAVVYDARVFAP